MILSLTPLDTLSLLGVGLGVAVLVAGLVLARKGRRALAIFGLMLALLAGMLGDWQLNLGSGDFHDLVIIDVSASHLACYDAAAWQRLASQLQNLHALEARPTQVVFTDREVMQTLSFTGRQPIDLGPLPQRRQTTGLGFAPARALEAVSAQLARVFVVSDGGWHDAPILAGVEKERINLLLPSQPLADAARVVSLAAPDLLAEGEDALVQVVVAGSQAGPGKLFWQLADAASANREITLSRLAARQQITLSAAELAALGSSEVRLRVWLESPSADLIPENNRLERVLTIGGKSRLLLVSSAPDAANAAATKLLEAGGYQVKVIAPAQMPRAASGYLGFTSIILDDVPLAAMADGGASLREAVMNFGANLIVAGSRGAWGAGGYQGTRFEQMCPLDANPKPEHRRWHLLLIDASDSMNELHQGQARFAWLREALAVYLGGLDSEDHLLVLPFNRGVALDKRFFEDATLSQREAILSTIANLRPSGQTYLQSSLGEALVSLRENREKFDEEATIVLISDGIEGGPSVPNIYAELAAQSAHLRVLLLNTQTPAWLATLEAEDTASGQARISIQHVADIGDLAKDLRRELKEQNQKLLHAQAGIAQTLQGEGETMRVGPWIETSAKTGAATHELSRFQGVQAFPLAARWRYIQGEVVGIAASLTSADATLANDAAWQKHFAAIVAALEGNDAAHVLKLAQRDGELRLELLAPELIAATPQVYLARLQDDGSLSQEVRLRRDGPDGVFLGKLAPAGGSGQRARVRIVEGDHERELIVAVQGEQPREYLTSFTLASETTPLAIDAGINVLPAHAEALPKLPAHLDPARGISLRWLLLPLILAASALFLMARRRDALG